MKKGIMILVAVLLVAAMAVGCSAPAEPTASESASAAATQEASQAPAETQEASQAPSESASAAAASGDVSSEWSGLPADTTPIDFGLNADEVKAGNYTIGFAQCVMDHPYRLDMVDRAQKWCDENGVKMVMMDGEGEPSKEVSNIESLIAQKVDAIVISSHGGIAISPALQQAADAGIPVALIDGGKPFDDWTYLTWMSTDDWQLGTMAAEKIVEDIGGEGKIIQLEGTSGSSCTTGRKGGAEEVFAANPGIEIVADQDCNWLRNNAIDTVTNALQANPDVKAVYAHNDEMALGAIEAIEKAGKVPGEDILVYSAGDYQQTAFDAIKAGKMELTQIYMNNGDYACQAAIASLMGKDIPQKINLGTEQATAENVDTRTAMY